MATGFCTLEDLRRTLRKAKLPGDVSQDKQIAVDAIASRTEWIEKTYSRYWYEPNGISEATEVDIPTSVSTRDDEEDIPTHGAMVHGASEQDRFRTHQNSDALLESGPRHERRREDFEEPKQEIRITFGRPDSLKPPVDDTVPAYTEITLARKDVKAINTLSVVNEDGGFDDWVGSNDYDGGVGNVNRGDDYWVRVNNGGVSELYLDVHAMDDDIPSFSNAVYVDFDYGHKGIPRNVRRAVANWAAADLVEEAVIEIPQNTTIYNVETKAEELRSTAEELMEVYE
jgi:hypothetical protein